MLLVVVGFWLAVVDALKGLVIVLAVICNQQHCCFVSTINLARLDDFVLNFDVENGGAACAMIHILRPCFFDSKIFDCCWNMKQKGDFIECGKSRNTPI